MKQSHFFWKWLKITGKLAKCKRKLTERHKRLKRNLPILLIKKQLHSIVRAALLAAAEVVINHRWAELIKDCVQGGKLNRFWARSLISRDGFQEDETDSLAVVPSNNSFSFGVKGNFKKSGRFRFYILVRKSEVCFSDKFQIFYFAFFSTHSCCFCTSAFIPRLQLLIFITFLFTFAVRQCFPSPSSSVPSPLHHWPVGW